MIKRAIHQALALVHHLQGQVQGQVVRVVKRNNNKIWDKNVDSKNKLDHRALNMRLL